MILEKNKYYSSLKLFKLFSFLAFFDIDTTCGINFASAKCVLTPFFSAKLLIK